jgi:hypothetical protein
MTGRSDRYVLFTILLTEREKIYKLVYLAIGKPIFNIRKRKKAIFAVMNTSLIHELIDTHS